MKLTAKEQAEHERLSRRILLGQKVTRRQVTRAFELLRKKQAKEA